MGRGVVGALALVGLMAGTASAGGHRRVREVVYVPTTSVVVSPAPVAVAPTAYVTPTVVTTTRTVVAAPAPVATTYVVPTTRVRVVRPRVVVADPLVVPATAVYAPVYALYP
jgi:hypothetical protein